MNILKPTPYLVDETTGPQLLESGSKLADQVSLLRKRGALDDRTLEALRKEWGFSQVYESAGIEGNQLTLSETQIAIQRGITISGKPPEHSDEVRNLYKALEFLEVLAREKTQITEMELREIHQMIIGGGQDAGTYRVIEVEISNSPHKPLHPLKVPEQMHEYAKWLASATDVPVPLLAAVAHAWLVHIHPFKDGNGRTARAVMNLLLMRAGFPIVLIRRKDRQRYYEALRMSDEGDIGPFLDLIIERCHDSLKQIDRVRAAATGISLAVEKVRAAEERRFRLWSDGIRLLATSLEDHAKQLVDAGLGFSVSSQHYDMPASEDYRHIRERNVSGNTWLLRIDISRAERSRSVLFWIGYSSDDMMHELKLKETVPAVWLSQQSEVRYPPWRFPDHTFPTPTREIVFHEGRFFRREDLGGPPVVRPFDTVVALSSKIIQELVEGWFA